MRREKRSIPHEIKYPNKFVQIGASHTGRQKGLHGIFVEDRDGEIVVCLFGIQVRVIVRGICSSRVESENMCGKGIVIEIRKFVALNSKQTRSVLLFYDEWRTSVKFETLEI
jgi:hypothetical protein